MNGEIRLDGLDKVMGMIERSGKYTREAILKGFEAAGMDIIAEAQRNLRNNGSVVTGALRQSGHIQKTKDGIDVGFFDTTGKNSGYAWFVEFGRRAGKFPPLDEIQQWAYKKLNMDEKASRSVGFMIARKIARFGTKPHPFFQPAVEKIMPKLEEYVKQEWEAKVGK